ncbi:phosphoribosylamine--glycine ligase [Humisphaera borealis]|uniref:Phosphoribosylamine--glycine ligase n=1 Tax=Humisphaera borealis TaxID=2807512 RepID=A0A7M2WRD6_9BACT|nr:phosphoribosylamine--glycine ligase [Humisphaera borealis]QOV88078.1 phosphoribosylamine--glycine ligase [Humisphaera borealis]
MNVLLLGNGAREHALAWKLADSPRVKSLYALPGNPGTAQVADNVDISLSDFAKIEQFVQQNRIELVVVGPEDPLAAGITDHLAKTGVRVFGPNKAGAQLEADKWFAKELMRQQSIPTAEARSFTSADAATEFVKVRNAPCVVKAAGLAKGKGVSVCYRVADALEAIDQAMRQKVHGAAGNRVVIEELMSGPEVSVLAFVDGRSIYVMETSQDHKPVDDGDTGPMTGGMGAYSPTPVITDAVLKQVEREVLVPTLDGLVRDGIDYKGVLYAGLMVTAAGPRVLEFNCRFGDPETQPLMMRLKTDIVDIMVAVCDGKLDQITLQWDPRPAICVVACSKGYPGKYPTGVPITGVADADAMPDVKVFQGGTKIVDGKLVTDGGRVLGVTAIGNTIAEAREKAYKAMEKIHFDGMHYRRDIGHQALR